MEKPIVFLSHSSKDAISLKRLREMLLAKTNSSIEFFLSSDGESIPFGRNWIGAIQDALERAKIMFVFVSPQSVGNTWVYFESGFTYSKGIRVIPLGILGIELGKVPPPLSLLQGFNVTSHEGLNNILRVFNDEFDTKFKDAFDKTEFSEIFSDTATGPQEFGVYASLIDLIELRGISVQKVSPLLRDCFSRGGLVTHYSTYKRDKETYHTFSSNGIEANDEPTQNMFKITCSPELAFMSFPLIEEALSLADAKRPIAGDIFMYRDPVESVRGKFKVSSRVLGSAITLNSEGKFAFKGYTFEIRGRHFHPVVEQGGERKASTISSFR